MSQAGNFVGGTGNAPIETITPDSGIIVVPNGAGNVNIVGGSNINTVGTLNTLTINLDDNIVIESMSTATNSPTDFLLISGNTIQADGSDLDVDINITAKNAGNINVTTTAGGNFIFVTGGSGAHDVTARAEIFRGISSASGSLTMVRNELQEKIDTSDATPTTLLGVALAEGQMISFKALINGFRSTSLEAVAAQVFAGVIRPSGGGATLLGVPVIDIESNTSIDVLLGVDVNFTVSGNNALFVVTGRAAEDWYWAIDVIEFITDLP